MLKRFLWRNKHTSPYIKKISEFKYKYLISDKRIMEMSYYSLFGKRLNLKNPNTFNEKLQWLKINNRNHLITTCADKYSVREYIEQKKLSHILNELYGVYENISEIDISKMPNSFVLKATHGSGWNIICKDKNQINWENEFEKINDWLNTNYYYLGREWAYKNIKPRLIFERYLIDENGEPPKDYKFFCFNGQPKVVQVDLERFKEHKRNMYNMNWELLEFEYSYKSSKEIIEKPYNFNSMIEIAKVLSEDFPFVRVDLYNIDGEIYFGELTFYPENGQGKFAPEEYDYVIGSELDLTKI
jgi:hypothetical protein